VVAGPNPSRQVRHECGQGPEYARPVGSCEAGAEAQMQHGQQGDRRVDHPVHTNLQPTDPRLFCNRHDSTLRSGFGVGKPRRSIMLVIERSGDDSKPTVGVCHVRFRSHRHRALPVLVAFGHGAGLAAGLGTPHPVLGVPAGCPQDPLHHQFQRVVRLSAAEDHLKPWPFPPRRAVVSCCGWRSATSRTTRLATRQSKPGGQERACPEGSSKAPNSKAGTPRTVPSAFPAGSTLGRRSSRTLWCRLAMVIRQRPDHEDVNADDQERPPGRVRQPDEVE
jgi:hypothetical protein